ncbi:hypothetical protein [Rhodococcus sp. NPDC058521]|uniref:hypothetical protein n=1 Tax=Rhodococcus sp. NPDC058521 TaxID=3346536 RepID=UPI0036671254
MSNPETPNTGDPATPVGGVWKQVTESAVNGGPLSIDREGIKRCIKLCDEHADAMSALAERARNELRVDALGIGEEYFESAKRLNEKFQDKAVGGGQIDKSSSALGLFRAHQSYARDMKSTFEAVLRAYDEQEGINTENLNATGEDI